jgi:hypothetical protein
MREPGTAARWIHAAVLLLSLACFGWVLWPVWRHGRELAAGVHGGALWRGILLGAVLYALLSVLLALAWWWLAGIYGPRPTVRTGYAVYARSQLAKYLPGNAFHYVSRQLLGRRAGLSHPALVASGLLELGSLLLAAVLAAAVGLRVARSAADAGLWSWPWALAAGLAALVAWPLLDALLRRWRPTSRWLAELPHLSLGRTLRLLGPAVALHLAFFAGVGILLMLLASAWERPFSELASVLWAFPIAWAAGTVAVGAPAGVGVREAVLALALEPLVGPARAAALALALRLVTTGGDLLSALLGWRLRERRG